MQWDFRVVQVGGPTVPRVQKREKRGSKGMLSRLVKEHQVSQVRLKDENGNCLYLHFSS
jgi:hypothetical protein